MQPKAENKSENNGECQDYTNFTEIWEPPQNYTRKKSDVD
jgi:hypothetical protein